MIVAGLPPGGGPSAASQSFCGAAANVPLGPPIAYPQASLAIFVDGPVSNLADCGIPGSGTMGLVSLEIFEDPGPPPCTWSSRTVDASIESVGAGWGTKVSMSMSWLYGCSGGPVIYPGTGSCSAPFAYDITDCYSDPPAGDGLGITGVFDCTSAACAQDHSLTEQVTVTNSGGYTCIGYVPVAAPSSNHVCHLH